jgi:glycosyltransferase involved in cell wall biosynthesis
MKIVQIVTQMEAGGAQKVALLLNEGLRERGHDARLWFLYRKRPFHTEASHVCVLAPERPRAGGWARLGAKLWRQLRAERPDAVVTHTHSANGFAAPIAAAAGIPVRVAVHHNPLETYSLPMRVADRCAFSIGCYSAMVAVSGGVLRSFAAHESAYKRRMHRIYNAIAPGRPEDLVSEADVRARYGISAEMRILVNVGRLAAQKHQRQLLHLLRLIPDAILLIVGEGELREVLRREAVTLGVGDRVRLPGELPGSQVEAILHCADAFLLPSLYESFCLAAVEAMQCGLPVIARDLACLREVLGDGQLFFRGDLEELASKTRYLLDHPLAREAIGRSGRAQAERFTVERMVGEYECLLAEAALYARARPSAMDDLGRFDAVRRVPRIDYHL